MHDPPWSNAERNHEEVERDRSDHAPTASLLLNNCLCICIVRLSPPILEHCHVLDLGLSQDSVLQRLSPDLIPVKTCVLRAAVSFERLACLVDLMKSAAGRNGSAADEADVDRAAALAQEYRG